MIPSFSPGYLRWKSKEKQDSLDRGQFRNYCFDHIGFEVQTGHLGRVWRGTLKKLWNQGTSL